MSTVRKWGEVPQDVLVLFASELEMHTVQSNGDGGKQLRVEVASCSTSQPCTRNDV